MVHNVRGSVLIETSASLAFCAATLAAGLGVSYATFARFWLNRAAYEASICLSTSVAKSRCDQALRETTREALPLGHVENLNLFRSKTEARTSFQWHLSRDFFLKIENAQKLPLLGSAEKAVSL